MLPIIGLPSSAAVLVCRRREIQTRGLLRSNAPESKLPAVQGACDIPTIELRAELAAHRPERVSKMIVLDPIGLWRDDVPVAPYMLMPLPGITLSTSADDFAPIKQMQLQKFDGTTWKLFGEVISGSGS